MSDETTNETVPTQGEYTERGERLNESGELVNADGDRINPQGQKIDDNGNVIEDETVDGREASAQNSDLAESDDYGHDGGAGTLPNNPA